MAFVSRTQWIYDQIVKLRKSPSMIRLLRYDISLKQNVERVQIEMQKAMQMQI